MAELWALVQSVRAATGQAVAPEMDPSDFRIFPCLKGSMMVIFCELDLPGYQVTIESEWLIDLPLLLGSAQDSPRPVETFRHGVRGEIEGGLLAILSTMMKEGLMRDYLHKARGA
jgi:hypothetical protein